MAYDKESDKTTADNCEVHIWPRSGPGSSLRSIGKTEYEQCNNCLAMRITFSTHVKKDGEWIRVVDTKIVEPSFGVQEDTIVGS